MIWNLDLRWEWFTRPGEIVGASVFYKNLENPIERSVAGGTNGQIIYQKRAESHRVRLEFEARTGLDRVSPMLAHFKVGANVTISKSRIDISGEFDGDGKLVGGELFARRLWDPTAETRDLQGQLPFLINATLSYENYPAGTYAGLHYNVFGRPTPTSLTDCCSWMLVRRRYRYQRARAGQHNLRGGRLGAHHSPGRKDHRCGNGL